MGLRRRIQRQEEDRGRGGDRIGGPNAGLNRLAMPSKRRQNQQSRERATQRAGHREPPLTCYKVLVLANKYAVDQEGQGDPGG